MVTYIPSCSLVVANCPILSMLLVICAKNHSLFSTQLHILFT
jgi:hypothetical protein